MSKKQVPRDGFLPNGIKHKVHSGKSEPVKEGLIFLPCPKRHGV